MSDYLEEKLIKHMLKGISYISPTWAVYFALYTSNPGERGIDGTEVNTSNTGYNRMNASFTVADGVATLSDDISFPIATASWGTITHFALRDDYTGGNLLFYGALSNSLSISTQETLIISASGLRISLNGTQDGGWGQGTATDVLNFVLNGYSYPTPGTSIYLALGRSLITTATYNFSSWLEIPQAAGYSRKLIGNDWNYISEGTVFNLNNIVFTENATVNWGNIANCALFNSSSAGEAVFWGTIGTPRNILTGDGLIFPSNSIRVSIDAQV
jgi:hypothetical protein